MTGSSPDLTARSGQPMSIASCAIMQDKADAAGARKTHTEHGLRDLGRRIRKHASLPDTVSFASFRKGGMTEMGEAGLTDQLIVGLSGPSDPADGQRLLEGGGAPPTRDWNEPGPLSE